MSQVLASVNASFGLVLVAVAIYLALVVCAHLLRRIRGLRFGWTYHAFAAAAAATAALAAVHPDVAWREAALRHLGAATTVLAAFPVVAILNHALWTHAVPGGGRERAPGLLADTTRLVVIAAVALAVLQLFYGVKVPGLLAGSGVAALVLGLAMQDLLGNIMAGFALYAGKPFKPGDWLLVEGQHARVVELAWRSTRFVTLDDTHLEVPNVDLVKRPMVNFALPTQRHAVRATIGLAYAAPPARAMEVLQEAARSVAGVADDPAPAVFLKEFADSAVVYELKVWIDDHATHARVLSDVRSHCWYAARRAGLEIPFPQLTLHQAPRAAAPELAHGVVAGALRGHEIFRCLGEERIAALVRTCPVLLFAPGERLVEQGGEADSMFLVVNGAVEVRVARGDHTTVVTTLGPGDCIGEMSLLTGEPRSATAVARGEVEAVEITKAAFADAIRDHAEVLVRLSDLVTRRQLANRQIAAGDVETHERARAGVLAKLRAFFELSS